MITCDKFLSLPGKEWKCEKPPDHMGSHTCGIAGLYTLTWTNPDRKKIPLKIKPSEQSPGLDQKGRKKIAVLRKRIDFLEDRVKGSPRHLSWDEQEISALKWAVEKIERIETDEASDQVQTSL